MPNLPEPNEIAGNGEFTDEFIAEALRRNNGLQYLAADDIGMNYTWMSERISRSPYLKMVKKDCIEKRKDKYERLLDKKAEDESLGAIIYFLKTVARDRGYGEEGKVIITPEAVNALSQAASYYEKLQSSRNKEDTNKASE